MTELMIKMICDAVKESVTSVALCWLGVHVIRELLGLFKR